MKVSKAQAQANRAHVVETASRLFRERGYDGVSVADLMAAAGFTHGGFYKYFAAKTDLMAEAASCAFTQTASQTTEVSREEFVQYYLSREHRDALGQGCIMAALCADTARQPEPVKAAFAAGLEQLLATLAQADAQPSATTRAKHIDNMAHMIGALVLSRACPDDSPLSDEILAICKTAIQSQPQ